MKYWDTLGKSVISTRTFEIVADANTAEFAQEIVRGLESAAQLATAAQRERELRELAEEWRAYADGDYCQTYNKGAALALHRAANDIARLLASADGAEKE